MNPLKGTENSRKNYKFGPKQTLLLKNTQKYNKINMTDIFEADRSVGGGSQQQLIELRVQCTDLANLDTFTKTDPLCVLFVKTMGKWVEYGRTEAINNTLNPKFIQCFVLEFNPRKYQYLKFSVYDIDSRTDDLTKHDYVGSVEMTFMDVVDLEQEQVLTCNKILRINESSRPRGTISVTSEFISDTHRRATFHVAGHKLEKKGLFKSKPDVYLEISREIVPDSDLYHPVFRTEIYPKSKNPRWRPFSVSVQQLCNNQFDRRIQLSCWSVTGSSPHMIGKYTTTMKALQTKSRLSEKEDSAPIVLDLENPKHASKDNVKGQIKLIQFRVEQTYSLMDFLRGGLHIKLIVGIDFTASNGNISEEFCLHGLHKDKDNQYIEAVRNIGGAIIECSSNNNYNKASGVSAFGFGAKWKTKQHPSHCFPLTGRKNNSFFKNLPEVIDAYRKLVPVLKFSGPTRLSPLIDKAINACEADNFSQKNQVYTVLLVITDGVLNDMGKSIKRLVLNSHLPLSVLFLGVGPADFTLMNDFVDDAGPLKDTSGKTSERGNTHFVPYNEEEGDSEHKTLKRDIMAVLSKQILAFMNMHKFEPNASRQKDGANFPFEPWMEVLQTPEGGLSRSNTRLSAFKSRFSVKSVASSAPSCPTCGAPIEMGPSSTINNGLLTPLPLRSLPSGLSMMGTI